jgi:1-aminocyclopropane-1-carboxylate deaminase
MPAAIHAAITPAEKELFGENNITFPGFVKISWFKSFRHGLKIERFLFTFDISTPVSRLGISPSRKMRNDGPKKKMIQCQLIMQTLEDFFGKENSLDVLRLDLPDPLTGGNKSFKLKYNIREMKSSGLNKLVTFGGAFSNHIAAVAAAGKKENIQTVGIIRGDELNKDSNAVLKFAASCGMNFHFVSREKYRERNDPDFLKNILEDHDEYYFLPEGGSNALAVRGCKEILSDATEKYKTIFLPAGTGATMAGIIAAAKAHQQIVGVAVLEGKNYLEKEVKKLLQNENPVASWMINHDFTFGGYAKSSGELERFIGEMKLKYNLPLDRIYSAKTLYAVYETMKGSGKSPYETVKGFAGSPSLFVHTGGYAFAEDVILKQ